MVKNSLFPNDTVKCCECGKEHDVNNETFVSIVGNIMVGKRRGVVGDNIREYNNRVRRITFICRDKKCWDKMTAACIGEKEVKKRATRTRKKVDESADKVGEQC
jgi:hypothetical protein